MRRRLRKKRRLVEFMELGFVVRAELVPTLDDPGFDVFLDRWIDAVETRGLAFGGGGRLETFKGFVTRHRARERNRRRSRGHGGLMRERRGPFVSQDVGPLVDAWR